MEAEATWDAKDNMHPMRSGPDDSSLSEVALQLRPDDFATVSKIAASPASEKPFPFLSLPPEIRNKVYRRPCIYRTPASWRYLGFFCFPDLRQAPITRVNKQIRSETLPMFYGRHRFIIELPNRPRNYHGPSEDQGPCHRVWEALDAFTPPQDHNLQANTLRFLSTLTIHLEVESPSRWYLAALGFIMSDRELHCDDDGEHLMETTGLNWNNHVQVSRAYVEAIDSCPIARDADELLDMEHIRCQVAKAANELTALMCHISRVCPQLTTNAAAFVDAGEALYDALMDAGWAPGLPEYGSE
ncbi:hypothetical protein Daus18300_006604 [Diaporthe australafricana]|uniref:F-box domain-containing protein n=1 Tax=Diaporthe australafricana TaxID=127596 RepID=A0ABR3WTA2_9PEZI